MSSFDTSNVTSMESMFDNCGSLTSLDMSSFDTSKVESMQEMFKYCSSLTSLDLSGWNTSNVTNMYCIFYYLTKLTTLDISGWSFENYASWSYFILFGYNSLLTTIISDNLRLPDKDMSQIGLDGSPKLTVDSIVGLLNALPTTTNGYSFQIGQTNIDKLSEEQKAIATTKGWQLV